MEITVTFRKDRINLPIATFSVVQGLLYRAMEEDPQYSLQVHENGRTVQGRKYKLFNFSELKGTYRIEGYTICFLSEATLTVRAMDPRLIHLLFSYFNSHRRVTLGAQEVEVGKVILDDLRIFAPSITVRTLSPITVYRTEENGHTTYFSPEDPEFYKGIQINAHRKWCSYYGSAEGFSLEIRPLAGMRSRKCATRFKDTFITAWHGSFVLTAPPGVLDFLYQTGLGSKNSQGFGMIRLIDPKQDSV